MVLVTGGSGFIGSYCIRQLLEQGYEVRTTVRTEGYTFPEGVCAVRANLTSDKGWAEAVEGCEYVLHVASPFPGGVPKHEDELIVPAREGTLRVLKAARDAGVKRVVVTSSFAAIGYGHPGSGQLFTEKHWTDPTAKVSAYVKSKTLAERAAWNFIEREGGGLELTTVNPVGVMGPVLGADYANSIDLVRRMLMGGMPGCPRLWFGIVDVRDVADLHIRAMTHRDAKGERFLAVAGDFMTVQQVAQTLRSRLSETDSRRVPTRMLPDWLIRVGGLFNPAANQIAPELGKVKNATNAKAQKLLGWRPRSPEDALIATAESLIRLNLLK